MEDLIGIYHSLGMTQKAICISLRQYGHFIDERQLRRILKRQNLHRRKVYSDIGEVVSFIKRNIDSLGNLHGYRWMYHKCQENGFHVRKEDVRLILSALDPEGSVFR
jgi:hypothetical protein